MPDQQHIANRSFQEIFEQDIIYEIPFFQRAYAWDRMNWKQLDDDINDHIITEVFQQLEEEKQDINLTSMATCISEHEYFFGPIVVMQQKSPIQSLKRFIIIDGQQRMTSVYLLIAIILEHLRRKPDLSEQIAQYTLQLESVLTNKIPSNLDDYFRLKILSNKGDRLPTYLMLFGVNPKSKLLPGDQQLYIPEKNSIGNFKAYMNWKFSKSSANHLVAYSMALLKCLRVVWIPLQEGKDDPQAIFESLNAKGTPLTACELLCSYLFNPLISDDNSHEMIHNKLWLGSIIEVGGERNFELYLRYLYSIGEKKMIGKRRRLYVFFKHRYTILKEQTVEAKAVAMKILDRIHANTGLYNQIGNPVFHPHSNNEIRRSLIKISYTRIHTVYPFLLAMLKAEAQNEVSPQEASQLINITIVLLVRRKISKLSNTKYDTFFPDIWQRIIHKKDKLAALKKEIRKEDLWVDDKEFLEALMHKPLYSKGESSFVQLVLQEIDRQMQSDINQMPDYSTLNQIEHIMPQNLSNKWKKYLGKESDNPGLSILVNTIGNLFLMSQSDDKFEEDSLFEEKKKEVSAKELSALVNDLVDRKDKWNSEAINKRSKDLAEKALQIWNWN